MRLTLTTRSTWACAIAAAVALAFASVSAGASDMVQDCFGDQSGRRIEGCTEVLQTPGLSTSDKSLAHAMRALAYSLKGEYAQALPDYDMAISLDPQSAIALNNRAWTLFKSGQAEKGLGDVQRSLSLQPASEHAHDTRAHIWQSMGQPAKALQDYVKAMHFGGERIVRLYQCGLMAAGLYRGEVNGLFNQDLRRALESCVYRTDCDPLPPDEDCRYTTS